MLYPTASSIVLFLAVSSANAAAVAVRDTTCTPPSVNAENGITFTGCAVALNTAAADNTTAMAAVTTFFTSVMGCGTISNNVTPLTGHVTATGCTHPGEGDNIDEIVTGYAVNFAEFDPPCVPGSIAC